MKEWKCDSGIIYPDTLRNFHCRFLTSTRINICTFSMFDDNYSGWAILQCAQSKSWRVHLNGLGEALSIVLWRLKVTLNTTPSSTTFCKTLSHRLQPVLSKYFPGSMACLAKVATPKQRSQLRSPFNTSKSNLGQCIAIDQHSVGKHTWYLHFSNFWPSFILSSVCLQMDIQHSRSSSFCFNCKRSVWSKLWTLMYLSFLPTIFVQNPIVGSIDN